MNPWHYEPGASEASPSVLPSDGFDEVSLQQFDSTQIENHPVVSSRFMMPFLQEIFSATLMRRTLNCLGKKGSSRKSLPTIPCLMP